MRTYPLVGPTYPYDGWNGESSLLLAKPITRDDSLPTDLTSGSYYSNDSNKSIFTNDSKLLFLGTMRISNFFPLARLGEWSASDTGLGEALKYFYHSSNTIQILIFFPLRDGTKVFLLIVPIVFSYRTIPRPVSLAEPR